jgi:hypothetical protein
VAAEQRRQWCFVCRQFVNAYRAHSLTPEHQDRRLKSIDRMGERNLDTPNTDR